MENHQVVRRVNARIRQNGVVHGKLPLRLSIALPPPRLQLLRVQRALLCKQLAVVLKLLVPILLREVDSVLRQIEGSVLRVYHLFHRIRCERDRVIHHVIDPHGKLLRALFRFLQLLVTRCSKPLDSPPLPRRS